MNTKQIKYVNVLANEKNFSKAAEVLGISQPSLSQYIKKIEDELGIELFERLNNLIRLTDAGEIYLKAGKDILNLEKDMINNLSSIGSGEQGSLRIGTNPYRSIGMLPFIQSEFNKIYPNIYFNINEGTTAELIDGMFSGEFDACITMMNTQFESFNYEIILDEEILLATPIEKEIITKTENGVEKVDLATLNNESFIMLTDHQYMQQQLQKIMKENNLNFKIGAVVKNLIAQIEFVKYGVGCAIVPSSIISFSDKNKIKFFKIKQNTNKRRVAFVWEKQRELTKPMKSLIDIIKSQYNL